MLLREPDPTLEEEFLHLHRTRQLSGEQRLRRAVLEDALHVILTYRPKPAMKWGWRNPMAKVYEEAREWVRSDEADDPFAFVSICESFGLNVQAVRRRVLR